MRRSYKSLLRCFGVFEADLLFTGLHAPSTQLLVGHCTSMPMRSKTLGASAYQVRPVLSAPRVLSTDYRVRFQCIRVPPPPNIPKPIQMGVGVLLFCGSSFRERGFWNDPPWGPSLRSTYMTGTHNTHRSYSTWIPNPPMQEQLPPQPVIQ